jgi:predicted DNA-binding transcriptional regulator YafY
MDTSERLLRLLSLLQARREWSGPELAERLGVTTRTVRRDVDRLRNLGYPVDAAPGVTGGYQLGAGASLPPLLLDDDEAIAVAVALGASATGGVRGIEDSAVAALSKIDRLLPPPLRTRVRALHATTERLVSRTDDVDAELLVTLSQAAAERDRVVLAYTDRDGRDSERRLEPYKLVATNRRWYLVAFDVDRGAWRTLRVDRASSVRRTGHRFTRAEEPDATAMVSSAIAVAPYRYTAVVSIGAPADEVAQRVPPTVALVEADGTEHAILTTGADDLANIAGHLVALGLPFEVREPPELRDRMRSLGEHLTESHQ